MRTQHCLLKQPTHHWLFGPSARKLPPITTENLNNEFAESTMLVFRGNPPNHNELLRLKNLLFWLTKKSLMVTNQTIWNKTIQLILGTSPKSLHAFWFLPIFPGLQLNNRYYASAFISSLKIWALSTRTFSPIWKFALRGPSAMGNH